MGQIKDIVDKWSKCSRCRLHQGRKTVVVGSVLQTGSSPLILAIGDRPSSVDDLNGAAFSGSLGDILKTEMLAPAGVRLAYMTNVVGCRTPDNREPKEDEISDCAPRIRALVKEIDPDGVILVGAIARSAWTKFHGAGVEAPFCFIVHPSELVRLGHPTPGTIATVKAQVAKIKRLMTRIDPAYVSDVPVKRTNIEKGCPCDTIGVAGEWILPDGRKTPLSACEKCGKVLSPPKVEKVRKPAQNAQGRLL